jgi:two-component system chemotaxis sensor kinase CheA
MPMGVAVFDSTDVATVEGASERPMLELPSDVDARTLDDFLVETRENLCDAEAAPLELEADPSLSEAIGRTFRAFHSVKSSAGFLGLASVVAVGHAAEDLLSGMRTGSVL